MRVRPYGTNERVPVIFRQAELSQGIGAESDAPSRTVKARQIRHPIGGSPCPRRRLAFNRRHVSRGLSRVLPRRRIASRRE